MTKQCLAHEDTESMLAIVILVFCADGGNSIKTERCAHIHRYKNMPRVVIYVNVFTPMDKSL